MVFLLKIKKDSCVYLYEKKVTKEFSLELTKIKKGEKISILSDTMFKAMFQNQERLKYSCKFLSYFLEGFSYEQLLELVHLDKNELDKKTSKQKGLRCDYVACIENSKINIEINNNSSIITMERNLEYALRLYASKVQNDTDYEYTQVIQFNLNNFAFEGEDKIIDFYSIGNKENTRLTDKILIIQIYIPNLRKKWYTNGIESLNEFEKYLLTLIEPNINTSRKFGKDKIMEEYIEDATTASHNDFLLEAYDKEWALKDEGKREGFEDGKKEQRAEIVKKMIQEDLEIDIIKKITSLSEQEILAVKESMRH